MTHTPHELHEEFPEYHDQIHALKERDAHFHRLSEAYHSVNREITASRPRSKTSRTKWPRT